MSISSETTACPIPAGRGGKEAGKRRLKTEHREEETGLNGADSAYTKRPVYII